MKGISFGKTRQPLRQNASARGGERENVWVCRGQTWGRRCMRIWKLLKGKESSNL